jgi:hypothetical protein
MASIPDPQLRHSIAAWVIAGVTLVATLALHLLPALLAGLLVYELVHVVAARVLMSRSGGRKLAAVGLIATTIVVVLVLALWGIVAFLRSDAGSLPNLLQKMAEIVEGSRGKLPEWVLESIPGDPDALKNAIAAWFTEHARELRTIGGEVGHAAVHILIGMVIGAMVSLHEALPGAAPRPLTAALSERCRPARRLVPARGLRAGAHLGDQHRLHGDLPRGAAADAGRPPAVRQDACRDHLLRRTLAGDRQPHLQHRHRDREPCRCRSSWRSARSRS